MFGFQTLELKAAPRKAGQTPGLSPSPCSSRAEVIKIDWGKRSFNREAWKYQWHRLPRAADYLLIGCNICTAMEEEGGTSGS